LASIEFILVLTGSAIGQWIWPEELEEEEGESPNLVDEPDSLLRGNERGTMDDRTEDEEDPDLLLEDAEERDLVDLDALLMLKTERGGIGRRDSFEGAWRCWIGWLEQEVQAGVSGGSIAEMLPL